MKRFIWIITVTAALALATAGCSKKEEAAPAADLSIGGKIYRANCAACHDAGVAGAPKTGDKAAWSEHIAHGLDHMTHNAIHGIGTMPPKGGNPNLSDEEIRAAVEYMVEQSR